MVISPMNSHNDGQKARADNLSQGTEELLRNILGPAFDDYGIKDGDSVYFPNLEREVTQGKVAAVAQQSQNINNNDPIAKLSGSAKELLVRYILGVHEEIIGSNL